MVRTATAANSRAGVDSAAYASAAMNLLEDLSLERERMRDAQRATINILEDTSKEKARLQESQSAIINLLEDLEVERKMISRLNAELEDRVRRRTEDLEYSNRNLSTFAYSIAHDLRAPLRAICGFSEVLLDEYGDRLDEIGRGYAERVSNAAVRMAALIDDLLDLAHLSHADLHLERVDLSELIRAIAAELQAWEPERRAVIDIEDGMTARVDRRLFATVLANLMDNAWKFTRGREETRIEVRSMPAREGKIGFFVRDNGVGFDHAHSSKLFQPFERLHSGEEYLGSGVGLAGARQVIERHGGEIWAEATPDHGATFYVTVSAEDQPRFIGRRTLSASR